MPTGIRKAEAKQASASATTESTECPACGDHLRHVTVYEHPACGKVGIREDFGVGNETKCPKCETVATDTAILEQVCQVVGCAGCDYRFDQFPTTADGDDFSLSPSGDDV